MKKIIAVIIFLTLQTYVFAGSAAVLEQDIGATAKAIGGAYSASVKDASALVWNPAGLANIDGVTYIARSQSEIAIDAFCDEDDEEDEECKGENKKYPGNTNSGLKSFALETFMTYSSLSYGRRAGFFGVTATVGPGTLGLGVLGNSVTNINTYDASGASTGSTNFFSGAGYLGYGYQMNNGTRVGFSGIGIMERIGSEQIVGGGMNIGIQKEIFPVPKALVGIDIQNIGAIKQGTSADDQFEPLSPKINVATALEYGSGKLYTGFSLKTIQQDDDTFQLNIGLAFSLSSYTHIMFGFNGGQLAVGFGVTTSKVRFAYSANYEKIAGEGQHFVELNFAI